MVAVRFVQGMCLIHCHCLIKKIYSSVSVKHDLNTVAMVLYKNMTVHNGSWAIVSEHDDPVDVYIFRLYQGGLLLTWFNFNLNMDK